MEAKLARFISSGESVVALTWWKGTRNMVKRSRPLSWPAWPRPACDRGRISKGTVGKNGICGLRGLRGRRGLQGRVLPPGLLRSSFGVPEDPRALIGRGCRNRQRLPARRPQQKETRWRRAPLFPRSLDAQFSLRGRPFAVRFQLGATPATAPVHPSIPCALLLTDTTAAALPYIPYDLLRPLLSLALFLQPPFILFQTTHRT